MTRAALAATAAAAAVWTAGCGGKPAPEPPQPKGPVPCERVGDHLVGLLTAGFEAAPEEERPTEVIDKLTRIIIDLCARGGWSADAQRCFLTVGPPAEDVATWDKCAGYLTVEQRDELPKAIDAAFGKGKPAPVTAPEKNREKKGLARPKADRKGADPCEGGE